MSFQTMQTMVSLGLIATGVFVGLVILSFPALAAVSAVQLNARRRRNRRDRWARQRVLQRAVADVAASSHTAAEPSVSEYPDPVEPDIGDAIDPPIDD